jgi:hypothetical protein
LSSSSGAAAGCNVIVLERLLALGAFERERGSLIVLARTPSVLLAKKPEWKPPSSMLELEITQ